MPKGTYILEGAKLEPPDLNWAGQPIRPGDFGYGGRPERIPEEWPPEKYQREVITEKHMCAVFEYGPLTKAEAAKKLQSLTGAHRTSCYRALNPNGRFARHLRIEGTRLSWK